MSDFRVTDLLLNASKEAPLNGVTYYSPARQVCNTTIYVSLLQASQELGHKIKKHLGRKRCAVLLYADSQIDNLTWLFAVLFAGHVPAFTPPLSSNPDYRAHLAHLYTLLDCPTVLTSNNNRHYFEGETNFAVITAEELRDAAPNSNGLTLNGHHSKSIDGLEDAHASNGTNGQSLSGLEEDIALLMLTSGSTGNAKAVPLRHSQILASLRGKSQFFSTTRQDVFLSWIALDHVAAFEMVLHGISLQSNVVLMEASEVVSRPGLLLETLSRFKVSSTFAPHFLLASLVKEENRPNPVVNCDLSSLRIIVSGGEACSVSTGVKLGKILEAYGAPGHVIFPGFGMTETHAGCIYSKAYPEYDLASKNDFGCIGHPTESVQMRVRLADGSFARPREKGALEITGPAVFKGYHNNPEATAAAFSEDGWFITGDLAYIDENGNLGLAGRKRDNVNINGVKFDLESLEAAIEEASFPTVLPSYTVLFSWRANGSESATESVVVVYIPTFGNDPSEDHLRYETSQNISRIIQAYCGTTPARILPLSTEALPKSSLGKLSRAKIRTAFETGKFAEFERVDQAALARHRETMFRAPSNHYEEAVRDAIAHISGVEPCRFSTASTLLEAGLTSMDLLMLKSDIERRLSLGSLPISMLVGGPTISKLAEDIADMVLHSSSGEYNPVVIFNKQNSAAQKTSPLWLLHPGAGEVLIYLQLTQYFPERAVYALRARGFDDGHPFWETYDEAVTSYADHVQRYQPTGPVVILGYSLGAAFAFGLAQRLQAQGREIQFLGLMNLPPDWQPALRTFNSAYAQLALGVFLDIVDEERIEVVFPDKSPEALSQMAELDVFDVVEKRFSRPLADLGISKAQFLHWAALALKLHHCVADRIPLGQVPSIDVFSAFPLAITRCTSTEEYTRKHLVLWQNHSVQPLRIHACEGRHYTMIDKENVASFQKTLKAAMRARGVF